MKYKAVLFDMDGVIVDSEPLHVAAFQAALHRHGHVLTEQGYTEHFAGKTDEAGFKSYFDFVNETADVPVIMDQKAREYMALAADQLVPYPGILEIIRELSSKIPLALVTGSLRAEADLVLSTFGIADCFKVIVSAEDINASKPDPEGYKKAIRTLGIASQDCIAVEDSPSGVKAAIAAGSDCVAVTNTYSADSISEATIVVQQLSMDVFAAY